MTRQPFYKLLLATDISLFGSLLTSFSIPLLIYSWSQSGIFLAIFELAGLIPSVSLGLYIGLWMRNRDSKRIWVTASLILSLMSFAAFLYTTMWVLLLLNIVSSSIGVITAISYQSMLARILKRDELSWGNSTISLSMSVVALLSPIPAAYLLSISDGLPFLIDAASFVIAAFAVSLISVESLIAGENKNERFSEIFRSVIRFIKDSKTVKNTLILFFMTSLVGGGLKIANVAYFSSFPSYYMVFGLAMVFAYAGDISVKSAVSLKLIKIKKPYMAVVSSPLFYFFSFFILFLIKNFYADMAAFFLLGMGNGLLSPNRISTIQKCTPREHLTAILGFMSTTGNLFRMLSVVLFGIGVTYLSAQLVYGIIAAFMLLAFVLFFPSAIRQK